MGIGRVLPLIKFVYGRRISLFQPHEGVQKLCIDGDIFCHQACAAAATNPADDPLKAAQTTSNVIISRFKKLRQAEIRCLLVFSGRPLPAKHQVDEHRKASREAAKASYDDSMLHKEYEKAAAHLVGCISLTDQFKFSLFECLRSHGLPYIVAPNEADAQLAALVKAKTCDGAISNDGDLIAYGCNRVYMDVDWTTGACIIVDVNTDADETKLANRDPDDIHVMFHSVVKNNNNDLVGISRVLATVCGCDYGPGVAGVGIKRALQSAVSVYRSSIPVTIDAVLEELRSHIRSKARHKHANIDKMGIFEQGVTSVRNSDRAFRLHCVFHPETGQFGTLENVADSDTMSLIKSCVGPLPSSDQSRFLKHMLGCLVPSTMQEWDTLSSCRLSDMTPIVLELLGDFLVPHDFTAAYVQGAYLASSSDDWTPADMRTFLSVRDAKIPTKITQIRDDCEAIVAFEKVYGVATRLRMVDGASAVEKMLEKARVTPVQAGAITATATHSDPVLKSLIPAPDSDVWMSFPNRKGMVLKTAAQLDKALIYAWFSDRIGLPGMYRVEKGYTRAITMSLDSAVLRLYAPTRGPFVNSQVMSLRVNASMKRSVSYEVMCIVAVVHRAAETCMATSVVHCTCQCAIGSSGACHHVATLLWMWHALPLTDIHGTPIDGVSPTSKECAWLKPTRGDVSAVTPVDRLVFEKHRPDRKKKRSSDFSRFAHEVEKRWSIQSPDSDSVKKYRKIMYHMK